MRAALFYTWMIAAAGCLSIVTTALAQDADTFEYIVKEGDSCAKIAREFFGPRRWDIIHKYNPNMGATPHRLVPGQRLILPNPDKGADAELTALQRTVQSREPDKATWVRAKRGDDFYRGWRVNTLERSAAELTFRDASVVQMRENTLIVIYGGSSQAARRRTSKAELERGELRSRLGELRMTVKTPGATADLRGGSSLVSVDGSGASRLSHHEGAPAKLRTKDGKATVSVKSGFGSKVSKGDSRPSSPRKLPKAPIWKSEREAAVVGLAGVGASAFGEWTEVRGAESYRVEIAKSSTGKPLVAALTIPATITRFELHGLPRGDYFARVSTVDGSAFESRPSKALHLSVELIHVLAPGANEPLTDVIPEDTSESRRTRVLLGTKLVAPATFSCAIGDAKRARELSLNQAGTFGVRCTTKKGASMEELSVEVSAPRLVYADEDEDGILQRGKPQRLSLQVRSDLPLPEDARLSAPKSVELRDKGLSGNARVVEVLATPHAPDRFSLMLVAGKGDRMVTLAELEVRVEETPPPAPTPLAEELEFAPNEAMGMALSPYVLSLFNDRRQGSGFWTAISYSGEPSDNTGYWRTTIGAEASFEERVRLGVSTAIDVWERGALAPGRGDLDIYSWINVRAIKRRDLSLDAELAAWFPTTSNTSSIDRVRLVPSVTVSLDLDDRLLLRTRQGAILNAGSGGPFFWASAYGFDLKLVRLFALGVEVDLIVGKLGNAVISDGGIAGGLSVLLGPASLYTMARYGFATEFQTLAGKLTFSFGVRLSFP